MKFRTAITRSGAQKPQTDDIYSWRHSGRRGDNIYVITRCLMRERRVASAVQTRDVAHDKSWFGHAMFDNKSLDMS